MGGSTPKPSGYFTSRRIAQIVALSFALTTSVLLLFLPTGVSETVTIGADGGATTETARTTLVEENGPGVIFSLALPVIAAALPLASLRRNSLALAAISAAAVGVFIVVSMFSVGVFYTPTFGVALLAVFLRGEDPAGRRPPGRRRWAEPCVSDCGTTRLNGSMRKARDFGRRAQWLVSRPR